MGSVHRESSASETLRGGAAAAAASAATSLDLSRGSMEAPMVRDNILDEDDMAEALAEDLSKDKNTAIMIWLGILIDAVPESMVIGFIVAEGSRNPLVFVVGVFLSNFPEALASAATMKKVGLSIPTILSLWTSTCVITGLGALFGALIIPESGVTADFELFVKGMEGLAAGAMLTMIAQVSSPPRTHKLSSLSLSSPNASWVFAASSPSQHVSLFSLPRGDGSDFSSQLTRLACAAAVCPAQTMLPEACEKGGSGIGVCCLCGFLAALLTSIIPF
jgi:zinc transporter ZupT